MTHYAVTLIDRRGACFTETVTARGPLEAIHHAASRFNGRVIRCFPA